MTLIQIELPDSTADAARDAGLLTPEAIARLITDAVAGQQTRILLTAIADRVTAAGVVPLSMQEIDAEVKAVRQERRSRASDH